MQLIVRLSLVTLVLVHCANGECPKARFDFRNKTTSANYNFMQSSVGNIGSLETCPYTGRPYVYLPCYSNASWGHEPYFSSCLEPVTTTSLMHDNPRQTHFSIEDIAKLPMNTSREISRILAYLNDETIHVKSSSDVASIVNIINRVAMNNHPSDGLLHSDLYSIANKLLSPRAALAMQEAQKINGSLVQLLSALETHAQHVDLDELETSYVQTNLAVSIVDQPNNRTKPIIGFAYDSTKNEAVPINSDEVRPNSTSITLSGHTTTKLNRLTFAAYDQRQGLFDETQARVLTRVISLSVDQPKLIENMGSFVKIHFFLDTNLQERNSGVYCAFLNMIDNMTARWSTKGCQLSNVTEHSVTCLCDHLTHFAVLMNMEQKSVPRFVEQVLSIITLIGLAVSSLGLCLTVLTSMLFKKFRRHFSQKSLVFLAVNLLFVNLLYSIISLRRLDQLENLTCIVIASLLHYFTLSSFSWMFIMALIQYLLFVKIFSRSVSAFTRKASLFSQIVPLIPVVTVLVIDPSHYTQRTDQICWLSSLPFYLSFILPIVLLILLTSALFFVVAHALLCSRTSQRLRPTQIAESHRLSRFSITSSCFLALGLTWIFSLFAIGPVHILCQVLFCIFASLTGFSVFMLYIVTSKVKRNCLNNTLKSLGIPSIYSPTSSSSSGFLGGKEYSISSSSTSDQQKIPTRRMQFPPQPQHYIDAYMPSSPPPPAPPLLPSLIIEGDDPLGSNQLANHFYEPRHMWAPHSHFIYDAHQPITSLDDYSLFYASNHDATKL